MIIVTGATGRVGRHVVARLAEAGAAVRAVVRDPATAGMPEGVEVVQGDLTRPETLEPHLVGADSVFLVWPWFTAEGAPAVIDMVARRARHVVYLSAEAAAADPESSWAVLERRIERSGAAWTFLRPTGFAKNTLGWADQIRTDGVVRQPYGAAARSLIDERDIAAVAVRALTEDGHEGRTYVLTGPEAVTQAEQARLIGEAVGRPVRFEELARKDFRPILVEAFGGEAIADSALDTWAGFVATPERVTGTVRDVTGVPARPFRQWAADHADEFR